jgi:hypothetical protein
MLCVSFSFFIGYRVTSVPHVYLASAYAIDTVFRTASNGHRVTTVPFARFCFGLRDTSVFLARLCLLCVVLGSTFYILCTAYVRRARPHPRRLQWHRYPRWP